MFVFKLEWSQDVAIRDVVVCICGKYFWCENNSLAPISVTCQLSYSPTYTL